MPKIGDSGKISKDSRPLPCLSPALGIKATYKSSTQRPFASEKNDSLGDFLPTSLLLKSFKPMAELKDFYPSQRCYHSVFYFASFLASVSINPGFLFF